MFSYGFRYPPTPSSEGYPACEAIVPLHNPPPSHQKPPPSPRNGPGMDPEWARNFCRGCAWWWEVLGGGGNGGGAIHDTPQSSRRIPQSSCDTSQSSCNTPQSSCHISQSSCDTLQSSFGTSQRRLYTIMKPIKFHPLKILVPPKNVKFYVDSHCAMPEARGVKTIFL